MKITREELQTLLDLIGITAETEINCEEFLAQLPGHLERLRAETSPDSEQTAFLHHLKICPECREEFEGLLDALSEGLL